MQGKVVEFYAEIIQAVMGLLFGPLCFSLRRFLTSLIYT